MHDVMAVVLAGGKGSRLEPLTRDRAKPAVPFGGAYRIIDFALSNCLNSGIRRMLLLTQYKAISLDRHINNAWRPYFCRQMGEFIDVVQPQQRIDEQWYQGTADAVYQNIYTIEKERPKYVVILAGDHIYRMNYRAVLEDHIAKEADLTIAALEVDPETAKAFGVMEIDEDLRVRGFEEKPAQPQTVPGHSDRCLASMGIYVFTARFLYEKLLEDANSAPSAHDFGKDIIPSIIESCRVFAWTFVDPQPGGRAYWRDVGTVDSYFEANIDLTRVDPQLNMYDYKWPIRTFQNGLPPPKFVFGGEQDSGRVGAATDSVVCSGSIISGGRVSNSVIGAGVRVNSFASVSESILFDGVIVGRHAKIRRAIIDKDVVIPPHTTIGFDTEADRSRGFNVTESGIVVIGKGGMASENGSCSEAAEQPLDSGSNNGSSGSEAQEPRNADA